MITKKFLTGLTMTLLIMAALFVFSEAVRAESSTDICDGQFAAKLENITILCRGLPQYVNTNTCYELQNRLEPGSIVYEIENVKEVAVCAYAYKATFVSWQDGEMVRGYTRKNIGTRFQRLAYDASGRQLFTLFEGQTFFCVNSNGTYVMDPNGGEAPGDAAWLGLNIDTSADGLSFQRAETLFSVTPHIGPALSYTEDHVAQIPEGTRYIRLRFVPATWLGSHKNAAERPVIISRVSFDIRDESPDSVPPPPPPPPPSVSDPDPAPNPSPIIPSSPSSSSGPIALKPQKPDKPSKKPHSSKKASSKAASSGASHDSDQRSLDTTKSTASPAAPASPQPAEKHKSEGESSAGAPLHRTIRLPADDPPTQTFSESGESQDAAQPDPVLDLDEREEPDPVARGLLTAYLTVFSAIILLAFIRIHKIK